MPHPPVFLQHIPTPLFVLEIWKACFVGLIESPEGTEELKWTAFTFLKVPVVSPRFSCPLTPPQGLRCSAHITLGLASAALSWEGPLALWSARLGEGSWGVRERPPVHTAS